MTTDALLQELRATFPPGATSGTFEAATVDGGAFASLVQQLGLPASIPLVSAGGWEQAGDTLTLTGTAQTALLGVDDPPVYLQLTPAGNGAWTLVMDVGLPADWTFPRTFAMLATGVFADLHLADGVSSALVVASGDATDPLRLAGGVPAAVSSPLTFTGTFDVNSSGWAQIAWLAGGGGRVTGRVDYDAGSGAVSMDIPLATGRVAHVLGSSGPPLTVDLALYSGEDTALGQYLFGVRLEAEVDFETQDGPRTMVLSALLASTDQGILDLSVSGTAFAFPTPAALAQWFGSEHDLSGRLPERFQSGTLLQVTGLTLGVGLQSHALEYASLAMGALQGVTWEVWKDHFTVTDVDAVFAAFAPLSEAPSYTLSLGGTIMLGKVPLRTEVSLPGPVLSAALPPLDPPPPLADVLTAFLGTDGGVPSSLLVDELSFVADVTTGTYSAAVEIAGSWLFAFGESWLIAFEKLRAEAEYAPGGVTAVLAGSFAVGENEFQLEADLSAANLVFRGAWQDEGEPMGYQDVAIALGMYGLPMPPEFLDLRFQAATFEFETAGPSFSFTIDTAAYGAGAMIAGRDADGAWGFVFGMEAALELDLPLTDIPVVGDLVPQGMDVISLRDLRIVGATTALPVYTPTEQLDEVLGPVVASGLALSIALEVGTAYRHDFAVRFGGADDESALDVPPPPIQLPPSIPRLAVVPPPPVSLEAVPGAPTTAAPGPQYNWVDVQRAFGPVQFRRIGFAITPEERLALALDGSVSLAGLTIALTGLSAEIPLESPYLPTFGLAGLAVEYAAAGLEIGGALVKVPGMDPAMYSGDLVLEVERFGAMAFGSYTTTNGAPSLFAFLFLDAPLGGPGFFFVTGLAGGFGFNRTLTLPTIDTVQTYPLVQGAMGTLDARSTIDALDRYIQPAPNEYWFAAGIRFTSYGLLRSYALATVSFGATVEVGLMGESTLALPPIGEGEEAEGPLQPLAEADLVLLLDVVPSSGTFAVAAQLSPASYVLSRQAHLTGGFAFYLWFPPSPHAGDFVVSLGGYNPFFTPPAHYPSVPRLGFSWTLSTELSLTGGLYCALTPSVLMAGGSLKASWTGGGLTAWFTAEADFLVRLRPFAYEAEIAVSVGVSYRLNLGLTTKTISLQVSGTLDLWGQPFGGRAWVDAGVVSFSFDFGTPRTPAVPDLTWDAFRDAFLPPLLSAPAGPAVQSAVAAAQAAGDPAPTATDALVALHAPSGLLSTFADDDDRVWRVDPENFRLVVATQVPSKTVSVTTGTYPRVEGTWSTAFGVGPMGAAPGDVTVSLAISVTRGGLPDSDGWHAAAVTGSVPSGVWLSTTADMAAPALVADVLTGVEMVPVVAPPDATLPVPLETLLGDDPPVRPFAWSATVPPASDPFDQGDAMGEMQRTLTDPAVASTRASILASLRRQGMTTADAVDVAAFAAQAPELMSAAPQLRLLGETPTPAA